MMNEKLTAADYLDRIQTIHRKKNLIGMALSDFLALIMDAGLKMSDFYRERDLCAALRVMAGRSNLQKAKAIAEAADSIAQSRKSLGGHVLQEAAARYLRWHGISANTGRLKDAEGRDVDVVVGKVMIQFKSGMRESLRSDRVKGIGKGTWFATMSFISLPTLRFLEGNENRTYVPREIYTVLRNSSLNVHSLDDLVADLRTANNL